MNIGEVVLSLAADPSQFNRQINDSASGAGNAFSSAFKKVFAAVSITALTAGLKKFATECIDIASDLTEVQNVVDTAFGDMAQKCEDFASIATQSFGISELSAKQTASTFMSIGSGMDIASDAASDMAINLAKLGGDVASFYNLDYEAASEKLKSVYTGETETLKSLGVVMSQTNLKNYMLKEGYEETFDSLTEAEKATVRYNFVVDSLSLSIGDFEKTGDSYANKTRKLSESFKQQMANLGTLFIQVVNPMIDLAQDFVNIFGEAVDKLTEFFGMSVSDAVESDLANTNKIVSDETKKIVDTTKKELGALASMDTFHTVKMGSSDSSTDDNGTANIAPKMIYDSTLKGKCEEVSNKVKDFFTSTFANFKLPSFDFSATLEALGTLKDSAEKLGGTVWDGLTWIWNNVLVPLGEWAVNSVLPTTLELIAAAFEAINSILVALEPAGHWLWENFLKQMAEWTADAFVAILGAIRDALLKISDWIDEHQIAFRIMTGVVIAFMAAWEVTKFLAWIGQAQNITNIMTNMKTLLDIVRGKKILDTIAEAGNTIAKMKNAIATGAQTAAHALYTTATTIATAVTTAFGAAIAFLTSPIGIAIAAIVALIAIVVVLYKNWDTVKEKGGQAWDWICEKWDAAGEWMNSHVVQPVKDAFSNMWNGIKDTFLGIWDSIVDGVTSYFEKFVGNVKNIASKVSGFFGGGTSANTPNTTSSWNVPAYASGTVVSPNQPHLAIIGDNTREKEVVSPVSTIKQAVQEAMASNSTQSSGPSTETYALEFGGEKFGDLIIDYINKKTQITGQNVIKIKK